jgi:hypothetical protein
MTCHGVNAVVYDLEVHLPERDDLQETAEHPLLEDEAQFAAVPEEEKRQLREAQQKAKEYLDPLRSLAHQRRNGGRIKNTRS